MSKEQDLSKYASFNIDDIVKDIKHKSTGQKEVTAYLDRNFLMNMITEYHRQESKNKLDFAASQQIDLTEYNFSGADFRGISASDFELFIFHECDITAVLMDRTTIDFFHELMLEKKVTFQGINLTNAYLGPALKVNKDLGIKCYMYLNLSNINLTGSNFSNCDIAGLILENTNITDCIFTDSKNLDPKQFAFTIGYDKAIFSKDEKIDLALKEKIRYYAGELNQTSYYANQSATPSRSFLGFLANFTNYLDN